MIVKSIKGNLYVEADITDLEDNNSKITISCKTVFAEYIVDEIAKALRHYNKAKAKKAANKIKRTIK